MNSSGLGHTFDKRVLDTVTVKADTLRSSWHTGVLNERKFWIYQAYKFAIVAQGS